MKIFRVVPVDAMDGGKGPYLFSTLGPCIVLPPSHAQMVTKAREGHTLILAIDRHS